MATTEMDIDTILRELINMLIDESTVDEVDEEQHFDSKENQECIDNEDDQDHIDEEEVTEDMNDKKDPEDIDEIVNTLLVEMVEVVCDDIASEAIASGDAEEMSVSVMMDKTPAEGQCKERDGSEPAGTTEKEASNAANPTARRGRARRLMATTWKRMKRVTRLMLCGCFRWE